MSDEVALITGFGTLGQELIFERPSVMNVSNLDVAPTDDDAAAVRVRWETCRDSTPVE